jgi:ABC-type cobalamin/Fe3+-siderophores transport system ATPase subunit
MRLDRVYIDGFKNLKAVEINFDERRLTTVVIGQNGAGKSNLIEAIADIFRFADLNRSEPSFKYELDYRIGSHTVRLTNRGTTPEILVDGASLSRAAFDRRKEEVFPDLIFGYYSGGSRRLESLFDAHQRRYYDDIKINDNKEECAAALVNRRLFYCRPIHGVFALLSFFAFPDRKVSDLMRSPLGVTGFHSALALFREPWFSKSGRNKKQAIARDLWGAGGPAGTGARAMREAAFHPLVLEDKTLDDYRDKGGKESQFAVFLKDRESLRKFAETFADDKEMFYALEAIDISDLFRSMLVWVTRTNDTSGDVSFADLSDGERQLLMVLGLIRVSRGRRSLFLLDEPDTHLNPVWQHTYLGLIREWTGLLAEEKNCHIVMTSHNPLTIAALEKQEVRVMFTDERGQVTVTEPYADPKGMGFTATLTEIFGLPTSLDPETQKKLDDRNTLAQIAQRSEAQERTLLEINDQLNRLGFMFEDREPLYQEFLQAMHDVRYADRLPLSPEQIERRRVATKDLIGRLIHSGEKAS